MEFHEAENQDQPQDSEAGTTPDGIRVVRRMRNGHTYETITEETRITETQKTIEHVDIDETPRVKKVKAEPKPKPIGNGR